ncbi:hypothetical protein B9D02_20345 (plasmid) [Pantoea vagans]|nr:hypothetical protein B9D02_20345 [Pantoea vagans]
MRKLIDIFQLMLFYMRNRNKLHCKLFGVCQGISNARFWHKADIHAARSAKSEKRKFDVKKLRSIVVDDDKENRTNQRISTSHHDDKS